MINDIVPRVRIILFNSDETATVTWEDGKEEIMPKSQAKDLLKYVKEHQKNDRHIHAGFDVGRATHNLRKSGLIS